MAVILLLTSCNQTQEPVSELPDTPVETVQEPEPEPIARTGPVKVGLLLPLTGPAATLGQDMLSAAQMALFDLPPNDFILVPRDTGGDPDQARSAAQSAIDAGAEIILGPLLSSSTLAVREVARSQDGQATSGEAGNPQPDSTGAGDSTGTGDNSVETLIQNALGSEPGPEPEAGPDTGAEPEAGQGASANARTSIEPVKVISYSSNSKVAGDGVYVLGFRPEEQLERIVRYASSQGHESIALLAPDDAYGAVALAGYRNGLQSIGNPGSERYALYPPDAPDQSDAVRQVSDFNARAAEVDEQRQELELRDDDAAKAALDALEGIDTQSPPPFDAIIIADGGNRLRSVGALLAFFDVSQPDVRMLGTMRWLDDASAMEEPNLNRSWVAAVDQEARLGFDRIFEERLGRRPTLLAQLAYDSVALAVDVGLRDRTFPHRLLTDSEGFAGSGGIFRFDNNGLGSHGLAVLEVGNNGLRIQIDPAPRSFNDELALVSGRPSR